MEIRIITEKAIILPLSNPKDVIKPTPAGINKNDMWDINTSQMSSIISILTIPEYKAKKSMINPKTVPGIGSLKIVCSNTPIKYAVRIIISCFKYFKRLPPLKYK